MTAWLFVVVRLLTATAPSGPVLGLQVEIASNLSASVDLALLDRALGLRGISRAAPEPQNLMLRITAAEPAKELLLSFFGSNQRPFAERSLPALDLLPADLARAVALLVAETLETYEGLGPQDLDFYRFATTPMQKAPVPLGLHVRLDAEGGLEADVPRVGATLGVGHESYHLLLTAAIAAFFALELDGYQPEDPSTVRTSGAAAGNALAMRLGTGWNPRLFTEVDLSAGLDLEVDFGEPILKAEGHTLPAFEGLGMHLLPWIELRPPPISPEPPLAFALRVLWRAPLISARYAGGETAVDGSLILSIGVRLPLS